MFKIILLLFVTTFVSAKSFNFTELRYRDAIERSIELQGEISFLEDGLNIYYPKKLKNLEYKNGVLIYSENSKEIELNDIQSAQITRYFDILILLHNGDESSLEEMFEVSHDFGGTMLKPKGSIKNYIDSIELFKEKKALKYVKLFLKNSDYITITIHDETD